MIKDIGILSITLYGVLVLITVIALIIGFRSIIKGTIEPAKLDKMIDLFKYSIVSIAIATVSLTISDLFREREQDVKELEYFGKYVEDIKKVDGIQERYQLARYLAIVSPDGGLRDSWQKYYDSTLIEYQDFLKLKEEKQRLDTTKNLSVAETVKKQQIDAEVHRQESPLVSYTKSNIRDYKIAEQFELEGFRFLLAKDVKSAINAFIDSENAANQYHQVYEISQYLKKNQSELINTQSGEWKKVYSQLATIFSYGMPQYIQQSFIGVSK